MAGTTPRFGLTTFDTNNDTFDYRAYKFSRADRILLDRLLSHAAERHTHIGTGEPLPAPTTPPGPRLNAHRQGGGIPANTTVYYRTVLVDERGQEQIPSQTASVSTTPPINAPGPFFIARSTSGTLMAGDYVYAVSAYTPTTTNETTPSHEATGLLPAIGGWTVLLPPVPSGAVGFNIFRKGPTDRDLRYLASVDAGEVAWIDDGTVEIDPLRGTPATNSTSSSNSISVEPATLLPDGQTLKIYRTYTPSNWDQSLLVWTAVAPITDTGHATQQGSPNSPVLLGNPPKINLGTDAEGVLPPRLTPTATTIHFTFQGLAEAGFGPWQWVNEYDEARVLAVRATLGRDATPASQPVITAIERRAHDTVPWHRYQYADPGSDITAEIGVGAQSSGPVTVPSDAPPGTILHPGDALRAVVLQAGGGATPTDLNLDIAVTLTVSHGSAAESYIWETT